MVGMAVEVVKMVKGAVVKWLQHTLQLQVLQEGIASS